MFDDATAMDGCNKRVTHNSFSSNRGWGYRWRDAQLQLDAGGYCDVTVGYRLCPPGTASEKKDATDSSTCVHCLEGEYSTFHGATACQVCPAGHTTDGAG